jgi:hypothetical protein
MSHKSFTYLLPEPSQPEPFLNMSVIMKTELKKYLSSGERLKLNQNLNGISSVKAGKGLIN